jgi:hypothetical protein
MESVRVGKCKIVHVVVVPIDPLETDCILWKGLVGQRGKILTE